MASRLPSVTPGSAATMRCLSAGAYDGATLLITATLSTGPLPVPSRTTSFLRVGGMSAEKYTHPTFRDSTAGIPRSDDAVGPSVATTTARAEMLSPVARVTFAPSIALTRVLRWMVPSASLLAICCGSACMPRDGNTLCPSLSDRKITSNMRREVARCGSS